jgi:hypothetical protein
VSAVVYGPPRRVAIGPPRRQCWHYFWPDGRVTSLGIGPRFPVLVPEETWWWAFVRLEAAGVQP